MKLNKLVNTRGTNDLGEVLVATCTKGQFKLSNDAAKKLDVKAGDFVFIQEAEDDGETFLIIQKSDEDNGNKLGEAGNALQFSLSAAWKALEAKGEADEDHNVSFTLGDVIEFEGQSLYRLTMDSKKEKIQRTTSTTDKVDVSKTSEEGEESVQDVDSEMSTTEPIEEEEDDSLSFNEM